MSVLVLKNISSEGPGTIGDYLEDMRMACRVVDLSKGDVLPNVKNFSHLVIMGGPMAVYEMDIYPFLKKEAEYIEEAMAQKKHILGICLGSQMIAHVLGAKVYAGNQKEVGWYNVALTDEALHDPVMRELLVDNHRAEVFQWHGDTFDLPANTVRLASSELYPNQAFRFSDRVYALQFHIEVTPDVIGDWFKNDENRYMMVSGTEKIFANYHARARNFYRKFFSFDGSENK